MATLTFSVLRLVLGLEVIYLNEIQTKTQKVNKQTKQKMWDKPPTTLYPHQTTDTHT